MLPHHPYSRVTAIPIVFDETRRELYQAREYYQYKRRCLYCDMLRQEVGAEERVVRLTPSFVTLVPYAARGALEAWVLPRRHGCSFEEALTSETVPVWIIPPELYGAHVYVQFGNYDPIGHPAEPILMSNGLDVTIGVDAVSYGPTTMGITATLEDPPLIFEETSFHYEVERSGG